MSETSKKLIADYKLKIKNIGSGSDSDKAIREIAAARLWQTGEEENQDIAEKIWKELKLHTETIDELKKEYKPIK